MRSHGMALCVWVSCLWNMIRACRAEQRVPARRSVKPVHRGEWNIMNKWSSPEEEEKKIPLLEGVTEYRLWRADNVPASATWKHCRCFSPLKREREHGVTDVRTVSGGGEEILLVQEAASKEGMGHIWEKFKSSWFMVKEISPLFVCLFRCGAQGQGVSCNVVRPIILSHVVPSGQFAHVD